MPRDIVDTKLYPPIQVGIWESRLKSQIKAIKGLQNFLLNNEFDRKPILLEFIDSMLTFGEKQFNYFYEGFGYKTDKQGFLEYSPEQPPEFVLRSVLNQLAYDTSALERAIKQRADQQLASALKQADVIAYDALTPALGKDNLIKQDANVITYFQKIPEVLVVPYANVALIGIPYSAMGENGSGASISMRDYLSIPHEVGHYVYWRGITSEGRLHVELRRRVVAYGLGCYENWLEEIFADVYGCLVGGEVMGLSAQDIHFDDLPTQLIEDNQEHPAPVIRPVIYMHTLNKFRERDSVSEEQSEEQNDNSNFVSILNRRWNKKLAYRGNPKQFKLRAKSFDKPEFRDTQSGRNDLKKIVNIIFDLLLIKTFKSDWGQPNNGTPLDNQAKTGKFESEISGFTKVDVANPKTKNTRANHDQKEVKALNDNALEAVYENFVQKLQNGSKDSLSIDNFKSIFMENESASFSKSSAADSWAIMLQTLNEFEGVHQPESLWNIVFVADGWGPGSGDGDANSKGLENGN